MASTTGKIPGTGALIYIAVMPLVQLSFPIFLGIFLRKKGLVTSPRMLSVISFNVGLPCLIFGKVTNAFTAENAKAVGPLMLVALIYQGISLFLGLCIRTFLPVPKQFRWGMLAAATWSNWAAMPTSVIQTITSSAPFNGSSDSDLGVAYVSMFIIIFFVTLFPLRGNEIVSLDYRRGPLPSDQEFSPPLVLSTIKKIGNGKVDMKRRKATRTDSGHELHTLGAAPAVVEPAAAASTSEPAADSNAQLAYGETPGNSTYPSRANSAAGDMEEIEPSGPQPWTVKRVLVGLKNFVVQLFTAQTIALISALIIALTPKLKALFIHPVDPLMTFRPVGPNGRPPLSIVLDSVNFVGAVSVPLGLLILGVSLANMKMPTPWTKLPLSSIAALTVAKLVILPVIGFTLTQALTYHTNLVPASNHVLRLVLILLSCTPSATVQVSLTLLYAPEEGPDNGSILAAYMLVQYIVYAFSSVVLTAITLKTITES